MTARFIKVTDINGVERLINTMHIHQITTSRTDGEYKILTGTDIVIIRSEVTIEWLCDLLGLE